MIGVVVTYHTFWNLILSALMKTPVPIGIMYTTVICKSLIYTLASLTAEIFYIRLQSAREIAGKYHNKVQNVANLAHTYSLMRDSYQNNPDCHIPVAIPVAFIKNLATWT